jgi:hypothetical protein
MVLPSNDRDGVRPDIIVLEDLQCRRRNPSMLGIAPSLIDHGSGGAGIQDRSVEAEMRGDGGEWLEEK